MKLGKFKTKEEFNEFVNSSYICVCGKVMTGLHELSCRRFQLLKQKWNGEQDTHPMVRVPKVTQ